MKELELARLLLALIALLSFSLLLGQLFHFLKMPRVIGEITSGVILGPTVLGQLYPDVFDLIFNGFPGEQKLLSVFYWFGLMLLMFTAGFRLKIVISKDDYKRQFFLVLGGLVIPLLTGYFSAIFYENHALGNLVVFSLIIGIGAAVTSIPVLSRIFHDLGIIHTGFARTVLIAAAIQDVLLWVLLSIALNMHNKINVDIFELTDIGFELTRILIFGVAVIYIIPRVLMVLGRTFISKSSPESALGYVLLVLLLLVTLSLALGINVIYGALITGLAIGRIQSEKFETIKNKISGITLWFFVPIYFALTGLEINLIRDFNLNLIVSYILLTSCAKIFGVFVLLRLIKVPKILSIDYGLTMNARGGPGIVLASITYSTEIIDGEMFIALILASVITSLFADIWLRYRVKSHQIL